MPESMLIRAQLVLILLCMATQVSANVISARVIGITDGDTIKVLNPANVQLIIRLAEVDAPEHHQAFGERSKQNLSLICYGKQASIEVVDVDRYERLVGRVMCEGVNANKAQVRSGIAWVYRKYLRDASLIDLENEARANHRGLWADARPIPPWEWRRR